MKLKPHFFIFVILIQFLGLAKLQAEWINGEEIGDTEFGTEIRTIPFEREKYTPKEETEILKIYDYLDPERVIPTEALRLAVLNYHWNQKIIKNKDYVTIIDFSKHSGVKRFYFLHIPTGQVQTQHVAHGSGSDKNHDGFAEYFSNINGSLASSLGFYLTAESYYGKNGFSMRLDGLESTNNNARPRAIVVHGADYVNPKLSKMGRSWGCPALTHTFNKDYIEKSKNGSLILAWVPGI